jgi:hypothetical protein
LAPTRQHAIEGFAKDTQFFGSTDNRPMAFGGYRDHFMHAAI